MTCKKCHKTIKEKQVCKACKRKQALLLRLGRKYITKEGIKHAIQHEENLMAWQIDKSTKRIETLKELDKRI